MTAGRADEYRRPQRPETSYRNGSRAIKITDVRTYVVTPLGESSPGPYRAAWVFVAIDTDEGITGIGECTNFPHNSDLIVAQALHAVRDWLIGRDPARIDEIWSTLFRHYTYLGNRGLITTVISGIDIALWDLKGKALDRSVYDLLGGAARDSLPLYTHPRSGTPEDAAEHTQELVEQGYEAVKFDPFEEMGPRHTDYRGGYISKAGIAKAAAKIEAVREAVGPDVEIMIDFHGNYNVASALQCIRALEPYDITWFEEPFPPEGTGALAQLRAQTDAPLCAGERLYTRWDFLPILRDGLVNFVMPDVCWTGGISELRRIASMAEAHFVPIAPHGALGPLQAFASGHAMMGTPNLFRVEVLGPAIIDIYNRCLSEPLDIRDGHLHLPPGPGLGIDLDWDFVRAHAHPDWPHP